MKLMYTDSSGENRIEESITSLQVLVDFEDKTHLIEIMGSSVIDLEIIDRSSLGRSSKRIVIV